jgi:hypothetical protein
VQPDNAKGDKNQHHPRRGNVGEAGHKAVTIGGDDGEKHPRGQHCHYPARAGGQGVSQLWHGELEIDAERGGGNGYHGPRQDGEHHAIGQVVEHHQAPAANLLKLEVKRQSCTRGNRRGEEGPAQNGEQVAELPSSRPKMKSKALTPEARKSGHDHQLRAGDVLARKLTDVILQPEQGLVGHRLTLVFIYRVVVVAVSHLEIQNSLELLLAPGLPTAATRPN